MQNHILKLVVFTSGMSVMAVEMSGLRLLAPYYGTSLVVTTILIGSLMGFLSLGYWLGGRWGDKHPDLQPNEAQEAWVEVKSIGEERGAGEAKQLEHLQQAKQQGRGIHRSVQAIHRSELV